MRTRSQAKRHGESLSGAGDSKEQTGRDGSAGSFHNEGSLNALSEEAMGRLIKKSSSQKYSLSSRGRIRSENHYTSWESRDKKARLDNGKRKVDEKLIPEFSLLDQLTGDVEGTTLMKEKHFVENVKHDSNEVDWEEGMIPFSDCRDTYSIELEKGVTIEFTESPSSAQKRPRRLSVEDKELAEVVHKVHLLCLIARGRLIDSTCDDPLFQASLLSLLPSSLLKIANVSRLASTDLGPIVNWFHDNFHLKSESTDRGGFKKNLAFALETHEGTCEEIAAMSVALFRALNLTARFVANLDVVSLKPDVGILGSSSTSTTRLNTKISPSAGPFSSSQGHAPGDTHTSDSRDEARLPQVHIPDHAYLSDSTDEAMLSNTTNGRRLLKRGNNTDLEKISCRSVAVTSSLDGENNASTSQAGAENVVSCTTACDQRLKRKGDLEFELQLAMALSATEKAKEGPKIEKVHNNPSTSSSLMNKNRIVKSGENLFSSNRNTGAVWSRKTGAPLFWAEVYCSGEALTGRWVHVDSANGLIDGEENVEFTSAVCKMPLRYVIAFSGNGAKDVTRRYCKQWYRITSQRIDSHWLNTVLAPLQELESGEPGVAVQLEEFQENASGVIKESCEEISSKPQLKNTSERSPKHANQETNNRATSEQIRFPSGIQTPLKNQNPSSRNSLEDMELETRALTEPLPTNQLAYRNHHLYAIEKWLNKYQMLHPKGPIVGYCSGHPVYPRSCVQTVQTRQKWLREGLQIQDNEIPAKIIKRSKKAENELSDANFSEDGQRSIDLFGRWQVEPLELPCAINGIVPKNEYGRVDVWSEKCLPPGTVHLRLPRVALVARKLEIDFANAMVGFEFRNGRSYPVYNGIVVCLEFRDAIMEAYAGEEERREAEEKRKNEADALSRWFQLLSSIITRQRLESSYSSSVAVINSNSYLSIPCDDRDGRRSLVRDAQGGDLRVARLMSEDHEHVFSLENRSPDEEGSVRTKRCACGFSVEVEEL